MPDSDLTSDELASLPSVTVLLDRQWAPCRYNCPVHADVRSYVELIARGQWRRAIDVIRDRLPFASVCGRVCHHPCETACRRGDVDEPVAIREVKRFVAELQGAAGATVHLPPVQDKARVAIIGAGPAGMSAGLDLAKLGYRPTVFEKFPVAGGIPATAIPEYRLPRDVLQQDIDWICAHGVEVVTGVEIGKDKTVEGLLAEGFEAVLLAVGLAKSRMLDMPGISAERVMPVMEFLTDLALGRHIDIGQDVLIIGGGNVAIDAARSAVRMGAKRVRAMCLESFDEMPAWEWELREAHEEGIGFIHRRGPIAVVERNGHVGAIRARKVLSVFDDAGGFAPTYDDTDVIDVDCDTVVMAIGQAPNWGFLDGSSLAVDDAGRMVFNASTHQTSLPNVFACGEIVTPPGSVVEACAAGQRAATAIDMYLSGREIVIDESLPPEIDTIPPATAEKVRKVARVAVVAEAAQLRRANFEQVDRNMDSGSAMTESRRCMSCGAGAEVLVDKCAACLTCLRVCPFDVPVVTDVARIDSVLCQACGICIADCPSNAIIARGWDVKALMAETARALDELPPGRKVVAYVCGHHASAEQWRGGDGLPGVAEIYLTSAGRLSAAEILNALENGADGVVVVSCQDGAERYDGAARRVRKRVEQVRQMLVEIGIDAGCVQLADAAGRGADAVRQALTEAAEAIAAC